MHKPQKSVDKREHIHLAPHEYLEFRVLSNFFAQSGHVLHVSYLVFLTSINSFKHVESWLTMGLIEKRNICSMIT